MENQFDMRMQDTGFSPLMTDVNLRSRFLVRTYANLLGAVLAFIALETVLFSLFFNQIIGLLGSPQAVCIAILAVGLTGPFIGSMIINHSKTISGHYVALGFYVLMYVVMFTPILAVAYGVFGTGLIVQAGLVTGVIFVLLSLTVFLTKKDFSFLRSFLVFA
ncbi:MAG: US12 family protein, partial [Thermoguttaceae bacterium]|nr:US12 family protein [Thermoguttaceae bacterium]